MTNPFVVVFFEFFMKIWFDKTFKTVSRDCNICRVSIHLAVLKVLTRKVFIDTIVIKFENTKLGIVEYDDTEVNRKIENNFLFRFFNYVIAVRKFTQTVKMVVYNFCSNFRLVDVKNPMMLFFVGNQFTVTGVSNSATGSVMELKQTLMATPGIEIAWSIKSL